MQVPSGTAVHGPGLELGLPLLQRAVRQRRCQEVEGPPCVGGRAAGKPQFQRLVSLFLHAAMAAHRFMQVVVRAGLVDTGCRRMRAGA